MSHHKVATAMQRRRAQRTLIYAATTKLLNKFDKVYDCRVDRHGKEAQAVARAVKRMVKSGCKFTPAQITRLVQGDLGFAHNLSKFEGCSELDEALETLADEAVA